MKTLINSNLKWFAILAGPSGLTIGQNTLKPLYQGLHNKNVLKHKSLFAILKIRWQFCQSLFTLIYKNKNKKWCIMHARPVVGDVTL